MSTKKSFKQLLTGSELLIWPATKQLGFLHQKTISDAEVLKYIVSYGNFVVKV